MEWATNCANRVLEKTCETFHCLCVWFFFLFFIQIVCISMSHYILASYSNHLFEEAIRVILHDLSYFHHLIWRISNLLLCVSFFVVIIVVVFVVVCNDDDHHSNRNRFNQRIIHGDVKIMDTEKNDAIFIPPNVQPINSCTIRTTSRTQHQRFIERLVTSASSSISSLVHAYEQLTFTSAVLTRIHYRCNLWMTSGLQKKQ